MQRQNQPVELTVTLDARPVESREQRSRRFVSKFERHAAYGDSYDKQAAGQLLAAACSRKT